MLRENCSGLWDTANPKSETIQPAKHKKDTRYQDSVCFCIDLIFLVDQNPNTTSQHNGIGFISFKTVESIQVEYYFHCLEKEILLNIQNH